MTMRCLHLSPADAPMPLDVAGDVSDAPVVPERVRARLAGDARITVAAIGGATAAGDDFGAAETRTRMFEIVRARGRTEDGGGTGHDNDAAGALCEGPGAEPGGTFDLDLCKL